MSHDEYIEADNLEGEHDEEWIEEEIDPQEVESVVASLERIMEEVQSELIHDSLQSAYDAISGLVDWEEDEHSEAA